MLRYDIVNADEIAGRFRALCERIEALPHASAEELTAWQREDMKRHYPNTDETIDGASTDIFPRSRKVVQRSAAQRQQPQPRQGVGRKRLPSKRPILRPELFDKLVERMMALLEKTMVWRA